jgi:hypothetical protein
VEGWPALGTCHAGEADTAGILPPSPLRPVQCVAVSSVPIHRGDVRGGEASAGKPDVPGRDRAVFDAIAMHSVGADRCRGLRM